MPHTINYNPEEHIIEVKVQGTVNLDEFKEIFSQATQLAKEIECFHILSDFREAMTIKLSTWEIYDMPKILSGISTPAGISASRFKRAIVIALKDTADTKFAETVTKNQGQNAMIFQDVDEAKKWLEDSPMS